MKWLHWNGSYSQVSRQTSCCCLPYWTRRWFGSGAITGSRLILNPNKNNALVVSRSKTVSPPHGYFFLSGASILASPSLVILGVKWNKKFTFEDHVRDIVSRVSQRIGILSLLKRVFLNASVLLRCYYAFVLQILMYYSPVWGSAAEYHLQLLELQVYSVARLFPDLSFCTMYK